MIRQFELVEKVKAYDPNADEDAINRAYVYSMKMHGTQKRASGDPYFVHPLEVANILTDLKLDTATIVTALLHDTVEDTGASVEEIEKLFGKEIAQLVDGVTKLGKIESQALSRIFSNPSRIMPPQVAAGGRTPRPMKLSDASMRIAVASHNEPMTRISAMMFGRIWTAMMRRSE